MGPFGLPTLVDLVALVERRELVLGLVLLGAGLVFMLLGCRLVKVLIAVSFAGIGLLIGLNLPLASPLPLLCGLAGGVGLAVASTFIAKISLAVLGGGWAGYVVMVVLAQGGVSDNAALFAGAVLFLLIGSLAFVLFEQIVAFVTSLEGALLFTGGLVVFLSHSARAWPHIRSMLTESPLFGPFLVLAGTVTGFYLQLTDVRKKQTGASG